MFKRLLSAVLAMLLLASAAVAEEPAYILQEGISWQSTPEEVQQVLGEGAVLDEERSEIIGKFTVVSADGGSFSEFSYDSAVFTFHNDAAMHAVAYFTAEQLPEPEDMKESLSSLYGEPEEREENSYSLEEYIMSMNGVNTMYRWKLGDTEVEMVDMGEAGEELRYYISFTCVPVSDAYEEAMSAWMEYIEDEE